MCKVLTFAYVEPVVGAIAIFSTLSTCRGKMLTPQLHSILDSLLDLFNNEMQDAFLVMAKKCDSLLEHDLAQHCDVKCLMQVHFRADT